MKEACKFIITEVNENLDKDSFKRFDKYDKKIAKRIIQIIDMDVEPEAFRVFPKGKGLICKKLLILHSILVYMFS